MDKDRNHQCAPLSQSTTQHHPHHDAAYRHRQLPPPHNQHPPHFGSSDQWRENDPTGTRTTQHPAMQQPNARYIFSPLSQQLTNSSHPSDAARQAKAAATVTPSSQLIAEPSFALNTQTPRRDQSFSPSKRLRG